MRKCVGPGPQNKLARLLSLDNQNKRRHDSDNNVHTIRHPGIKGRTLNSIEAMTAANIAPYEIKMK